MSFALVSCGGDDDNGDPELPLSKEQELTKLESEHYNSIITPKIEDVLKNKLGVAINRGINPPDVVGYYQYREKLIESTVPNDQSFISTGRPHIEFCSQKISYYAQENLSIKVQVKEHALNYNNGYLKYFRDADEAFISGDGDNFFIYSYFTTNIYEGVPRYHDFLSLFSGPVKRDEEGKITGIDNY